MLLDEVAVYLASALSLTVGEIIFKGSAPESPNACITLYEYGGFSPQHTFGTDHIITRPHFQAVCRGEPNDYEGPRTQAKAVYTAMHFGRSTLSTVAYFRAEAIDEPFPLERDANGRWLIAINFHIEKEFS